MIQSMTGFGKAEGQIDTNAIVIEIRSLNSAKGLDLALKIPSKYRTLEASWRNVIAERLQRGKIDITLSYKAPQNSSVIDLTKIEALFTKLSATADKLNADKTALFGSLIPLLPTLSEEESELDEAAIEKCDGILSEAIDKLMSFRAQEGETIWKDVNLRLQNIEAKLAQVIARDKGRLSEVRTKMHERIEGFINLEKIDASRLEQEVIFYLEKMDINEEISRLTAHCDHLAQVLISEDSQVGRKLNFIAQEMGREINTIGSKANDFPLQKLVVEMKDELEKIKEQTSNIL